MSTDLQDAPTTMADPFGGGLDKFMPTGLPSPVEKVEPKQEVQAEVKTEVEPKVEVKAEVKAETSDNLLDGISDEPQTIEQAQEEEPKEYPPEIRSMKAREHFDALKASKKAAERRAQELEAKVKDLESKGGIKAPEVAVALKERDEYKALWEESQKEMGISHIQGLTAFKTLDAKLTETRTFFQKVATQYEFSTAELDEALSEPDEFIRDKKLAEIADNIGSELTKRKFFDRIDPFLKDLDSMDELYKNAEGSMEFAKTQKEQEEAAAKLKAADEYAEARKVAFGHLKPRMTEIQEDPAVWEKVIADAESVDWDTLPPKMKAFAAVAMQSIQPYQAKVKALGEKVKHLEGVIASRNASSPGATGGSVTARSSENKGDFLEGMPGL